MNALILIGLACLGGLLAGAVTAIYWRVGPHWAQIVTGALLGALFGNLLMIIGRWIVDV